MRSLESRKIGRPYINTNPSLPACNPSPKRMFGGLAGEDVYKRGTINVAGVPLFHANNNSRENRHIITWAFLVLERYYC